MPIFAIFLFNKNIVSVSHYILVDMCIFIYFAELFIG